MFYSRLDFIKWPLFLLICCFKPMYCWFEHDRAVAAGQRNEWTQAANMLENLAVNCPENSEVMHDAGVAAYKVGNFGHAQNYFDAAAQASKDNFEKAIAYFNLGNSNAHALKLQEAIDAYEQALTFDTENKNIRDNLELVKKLLEQQKKNEKKDQESKKEQEKKDKENEEHEQQEKNSQGGENDSEQQQQKNELEKNNNESSEKKDEKKTGQNQRDNNGESRDKKNSQDHQKKQSQVDQAADENDESSDDAQKEQKKDVASQLDARLAKLLHEQEKRDAQGTKQMIKSTVGKQMVSNHGQNCW